MNEVNLQFGRSEKTRVILQTEAAECGLACLAMAAAYHGQTHDLGSLRRQYGTSLKGISLRGLMQIADNMGFSTRPLRAELESLKDLPTPCILHWDMQHFVVLEKVKGTKVTIIDPAVGRRTLPLNEVSHHFTGVVLEITPSAKFERFKRVNRVLISDLWQRIVGLKRSLLQLFTLAVLLQLFALVAPLFSQIIVDDVIARGDLDFLFVLAIGFALLLVIQESISILRSYVVLHLTNTMTFQMQVNLFRHLIRLPHEFFQKRHIGDIQARFDSLDPIEELLTSTLVSAVLDGIMAIATLTVIFLYSWELTLVVLVALLIHIVGTMVLFPFVRTRTEQQIQAGAKEQTTFLEIIRGLTTIKTFGRESERESVWKNTLADELNQGIRLGKIGIWSGTAESLLFGISGILVMYLGARLVINDELTLGMLFAFLAYQTQFSERTQALVESLFEFRMIGLHLERLSDIVHAEPEESDANEFAETQPLRGKIQLENVSFRYGETEHYVLKDVNLTIEPGDAVYIHGDSGTGKSTLLKLLTGLFQPTDGTVLVDDQAIASYGLTRLRRQIGLVSQDDTLLSGTIAENISFFDADIDRERLEQCAKMALIDDEINAMPMRYDSLVGDMGSSLSGGQRQRVLLARALYNEPKILIMDEGTANLDEFATEGIIDNLAELEITRIFVSHDDSPSFIPDSRNFLLLPTGALLNEEGIKELSDKFADEEEDDKGEDDETLPQ